MKLKNVRSWPVKVPSGSFIVKIYRIRNKKRRSFIVSYFVGDKRKQKIFVDFEEAYEEAKEKEGASRQYRKALSLYLNKFSTSFKSESRSVTTGDVGDFLREMKGSPRSKNNARQVLGAFYTEGTMG